MSSATTKPRQQQQQQQQQQHQFQEVGKKKKRNKSKEEGETKSVDAVKSTTTTTPSRRPYPDTAHKPKPKAPSSGSTTSSSSSITKGIPKTKAPPASSATCKPTPPSSTTSSTVPPTPTTPTPSTQTTVVLPTSPPPKIASWSQLFVPPATPSKVAATSAATTASTTTAPAPVPKAAPPKAKEALPVVVFSDEHKFASLISSPKVARDPFQPRGLINKGNTCFLNTILQSLIACEPFYNMLCFIQNRKLPSPMPTLESFLDFVRNYETLSSQQKTVSIFDRTPLYPLDFEEMLKEFDKTTRTAFETSKLSSTSAAAYQQKQEDAQEFLSHLLNKIHDEMLRASKTSKKSNSKEKDDVHIEEWAEVGKKNKTNSVVEMEFVDTPITRLFGIYLRSLVKKKGAKASINVEPSLSLSLDIEAPFVRSLEDALEFFMRPERLEGVTCSKTELEVQASKQMTIEKLPRILVIQLKRFSYSSRSAARKIEKYVSFPKVIDLSGYLSSGKQSDQCTFSLRSVISHHGGNLSNGHYTCDVQQQNGDWLQFDDNIIQRVSLKTVQNRQAYLLLYCQSTQ